MADAMRFADARGAMSGCWVTRGTEANAGGIGKVLRGAQRRSA